MMIQVQLDESVPKRRDHFQSAYIGYCRRTENGSCRSSSLPSSSCDLVQRACGKPSDRFIRYNPKSMLLHFVIITDMVPQLFERLEMSPQSIRTVMELLRVLQTRAGLGRRGCTHAARTGSCSSDSCYTLPCHDFCSSLTGDAKPASQATAAQTRSQYALLSSPDVLQPIYLLPDYFSRGCFCMYHRFRSTMAFATDACRHFTGLLPETARVVRLRTGSRCGSI